MRWAQEQRLSFIGAALLRGDAVNRYDIMKKFGVGIATASGDLRRFKDKHPGAMRYDVTRKAYVAHKLTVKSDAAPALTALDVAAKALALRTLQYVRPVLPHMDCDIEMERLALAVLDALGAPDPGCLRRKR